EPPHVCAWVALVRPARGKRDLVSPPFFFVGPPAPPVGGLPASIGRLLTSRACPMPALLRSDGLQNHWSFEDIKPDSQAHGLPASPLRSHRVPSMVERIIQRVREAVD